MSEHKVFRGLLEVRKQFIAEGVRKTGRNDFSGYSYLELGDFLPTAILRLAEQGLFSYVTYPSRESAVLVILSMDNPDDRLTFDAPMGSANLKACHDAQNVGAAETYAKRYLYANALELVEHDAIETSQPDDGRGAEIDQLKEQIAGKIEEIKAVDQDKYRSQMADIIRAHHKTSKYTTMKRGDEPSAKIILAELSALHNKVKEST